MQIEDPQGGCISAFLFLELKQVVLSVPQCYANTYIHQVELFFSNQIAKRFLSEDAIDCS